MNRYEKMLRQCSRETQGGVAMCANTPECADIECIAAVAVDGPEQSRVVEPPVIGFDHLCWVLYYL